jgi:hypothetical protein
MQHDDSVNAASFDATGDRVVTASGDTARIWDIRAGEPIGEPMKHQDSVIAASFDAKGERVVTASADHTARIWDGRTGEPIGEPMQNDDRVNAASFDGTGDRVVTASADHTARVWSAAAAAPQQVLDQLRSMLEARAPGTENASPAPASASGNLADISEHKVATPKAPAEAEPMAATTLSLPALPPASGKNSPASPSAAGALAEDGGRQVAVPEAAKDPSPRLVQHPERITHRSSHGNIRALNGNTTAQLNRQELGRYRSVAEPPDYSIPGFLRFLFHW